MSHRLQATTWDQAHLLHLATAAGFRALGIPAATVRRWAADGLITATAKAPGGAHLYSIAAVSAVADRPRQRPGRKPQHTHDPASLLTRWLIPHT